MCLALGSVNVEGVSAHTMMSSSSNFFFFCKRSKFINPLMKNLQNHHRYSHCRIFAPSFCQHRQWPLRSPWLSSFCSCIPFTVSLRCFSFHTVHVLQACVWAHSSLCDHKGIVNHAKASCLAPTKMGSESKYKDTSDVILYILASFSQISVLGTVAFPGWRTLMIICFFWNSWLVTNFLVQVVTVSFTMAADLQATRVGRGNQAGFWCYFHVLHSELFLRSHLLGLP